MSEYLTTIVQTLTPEINQQALKGMRPENLDILRTQLRQALANVEEQARTGEARMAPQTLDQVEAIEQKLNEALDELRARRAQLQQGSTGE